MLVGWACRKPTAQVGWGGSEDPCEKPASPVCPAPLQVGLRAEDTNCRAPGFCLQGSSPQGSHLNKGRPETLQKGRPGG